MNERLKVSSDGKPTMATPWKPGVTSIVWNTKYLQVKTFGHDLSLLICLERRTTKLKTTTNILSTDY